MPDALRTVLLCHDDAPLHYDGFARWLASWSDLQGVVIIREPAGRAWKRLRRERDRIGLWRLADVLAFRAFYRLTKARADARFLDEKLAELRRRYEAVPARTTILHVQSPNGTETEQLLHRVQPDIVIALVKTILAERIFAVARVGTFVLHPGICPEYRNSHGCFWALARRDLDKVGLTLVRIDKGIDTGPIYGYFTTSFDEVTDSHIRIQNLMATENLPAIATRLQEVANGTATPIPTTGRLSNAWGQPWLTAWWHWKRAARRVRNARAHA